MSEGKMTADEWATLNAEKMAEANKKVIEELLSTLLPKHDVHAEIKHWHRTYVSSALCSGKSVDESIKTANDAISSIYGALDFDLITQK